MTNALEFFKTLAWLVGAVLTSTVYGLMFALATVDIYARLHPEDESFNSSLAPTAMALNFFPLGFVLGFLLFWLISHMIKSHFQK